MKRPYPGQAVTDLPGAGRLARRTYFLSPASIPSLHSWYDAADTATITSSGGSVSQWNDKSGNERHAAQGTSTYQPTTGSITVNGRNVVSAPSATSGNGKFLKASASVVGNALTFMCVAQRTGAGNSANTYSRFMSLDTGGNDYDNVNSLVVQLPSANQSPATAPDINVYFNYPTKTVIAWTSASYNTPYLVTVVVNGTSVSLTANGVTATGTAENIDLNSSRQGLLGPYAGTVDSMLYGWLAEHIIYTRVLSPVEIALVAAYLRRKWGLR